MLYRPFLEFYEPKYPCICFSSFTTLSRNNIAIYVLNVFKLPAFHSIFIDWLADIHINRACYKSTSFSIFFVLGSLEAAKLCLHLCRRFFIFKWFTDFVSTITTFLAFVFRLSTASLAYFTLIFQTLAFSQIV